MTNGDFQENLIQNVLTNFGTIFGTIFWSISWTICQAFVSQCINYSFYCKGFGNQKRLDAHMTNGDCPGKPNPKWHYTNMTAKRLFCIHPECLGPDGFDINYLENSFNSGKIGFLTLPGGF